RAGVADLSTRLRVKGSAIEHDVDVGTGGVVRDADAVAVDEQREHLRGRRVLLPAGELGRAELVEQLAVTVDRRTRARCAGLLPRRAPAFALLAHPLLEHVEIDGAAALTGDLAREVDREAEGVVQEERLVARDVAAVDDLGEHVDAALERRAERVLLA